MGKVLNWLDTLGIMDKFIVIRNLIEIMMERNNAGSVISKRHAFYKKKDTRRTIEKDDKPRPMISYLLGLFIYCLSYLFIYIYYLIISNLHKNV